MFLDVTEYARIISVFPRVCVDIIIKDSGGRVLLLKRKNEPAAGQWWFPGGRIHIGETRLDAAKRKLREECGVDAMDMNEIGSFDLFFDVGNVQCHDVTIVFKMELPVGTPIVTDHQSTDYRWFGRDECCDMILHPYIVHNIEMTA